MSGNPSVGDATLFPLKDLVGRPERELLRRLGEPRARRSVGRDRWLLYERRGARLRIRCRSEGPEGTYRVASWTATLARGRRSLREATEPLGLWPAAEPDEEASAADVPLLRRAVRAESLDRPGGTADPALRSLTARVRDGRIDQVTLFDEPPDWIETPTDAAGGGEGP